MWALSGQELRECVNCLDKPKFGGWNKSKCVKRKCVSLTTTVQSKVTPKVRLKMTPRVTPKI